jgi:hypothetical protein
MNVYSALVFAWLLGFATAAPAAQVAGIHIDPDVRVGGTSLVLNGAGLRQRFKTDVYVIGLYFEEPKLLAQTAIDHYGPKRIALRLMRDVTAKSLVEALYEGIRDNATESEFAKLKPAADALSAIMLPLAIAKKGDVVALDYLPNIGSQVVVNGRATGQPVPGHELYSALLKIWLGDSPVDADLKLSLLGGKNVKRP